jgi:hypothetical protein
MENFNMYKKLEHVCSDKNLIVDEIIKYGLDNGVYFCDNEWTNKLLNFDVSDFSLVDKYTKMIEYLGIRKIEEQFVDKVCIYYFFEKKLYETLDDDMMHFFSRHWIFFEEGSKGKELLSLNWKNKKYISVLTDSYLIKLNKLLPVVELDICDNKMVTDKIFEKNA